MLRRNARVHAAPKFLFIVGIFEEALGTVHSGEGVRHRPDLDLLGRPVPVIFQPPIDSYNDPRIVYVEWIVHRAVDTDPRTVRVKENLLVDAICLSLCEPQEDRYPRVAEERKEGSDFDYVFLSIKFGLAGLQGKHNTHDYS